MAKIPYLIRRKNVFYFRLSVPADLREIIQSREITQSLRTQNSDEATLKALALAVHFKTMLHDLKTGKKQTLCRSEIIAPVKPLPTLAIKTLPPELSTKAQAPKLSIVVDDFLNRYDRNNKAMLGKLNATLPILVELIENKPVNEIFQTDINVFFDDVQKLPVRRDTKTFQGLSVGAD